MQKPSDGLEDNPGSRQEDQHRLQGSRDIFDLAVTERMAGIGRLSGFFDREEGDQGCDEIGDRMNGFRKNGDRSDQKAHHELHEHEARVGADG